MATALRNLSVTNLIMAYMEPKEAPDGLRDLLMHTVIPSPKETPNASSVITPEIIEKCRMFARKNLDRIFKGENDKELHFYQAGPRNFTFSHIETPGLVLKLMLNEKALDSKANLDHARRVFAERNFRYCHAPQGELAKLDAHTLFIMEKAQGETNAGIAQKKMEEEFLRIPFDVKVAEKWRIMTREVAEAVALIGYWDAGRQNFVWDSEKGWSFIDLEGISPIPKHQSLGLSYVIDIFPPQFVDEVYAIAEREKIPMGLPKEWAKELRQIQFDISRKS